MTQGQSWSVHRAGSPQALVRASSQFDGPVTEQGAADFLSRQGHVVFLAIDDAEEAIGFVSGVEMRHPDKDPEMFVYELGVDERWRRRGVARSLLLALRALAEERGCRGMWTGTEADNEAALATYRCLGARVDPTSVFITWDED